MVRKFDEMAWKIIKKREVQPDNFGPINFKELEEQVRSGVHLKYVAFPHLLDHFYRTRDPQTFAVEPSPYFSPQYRAFLAGVAEYLTREFGFATPDWVEKTEFFLADYYEPGAENGEEPYDSLETRLVRCPQEFTRRKVIFPSRGLIRL